MSTVTANVAQLLMQTEKTKSTPRPYKARLATKIRWYLGDAMQQSKAAKERMEKLWAYAEEVRAIADVTEDTRLLLLLGKLEHEVLGLLQNVDAMQASVAQAIEESKPEVKPKKYSEL